MPLMYSALRVPMLFAGLALSSAAFSAYPPPACTGNVVFGEGDGQVVTDVPNRPIGSSCMNELIIDTVAEGANYGSHGAFVVDVGKLAAQWLRAKKISRRELGKLIAGAVRSDVGKTMNVRVIAFNDFHGNIDGANLNFTSTVDGIPSHTPAGGVDYMAGLVKQLRAGAPNSVVVSGGRPDRREPAQLRAVPRRADHRDHEPARVGVQRGGQS